jgi:hypothetical protein
MLPSVTRVNRTKTLQRKLATEHKKVIRLKAKKKIKEARERVNIAAEKIYNLISSNIGG